MRPATSADFGQNYEPVRPTYPPATGSAYTVRTGDTLKSVAQALWGDSAMWYLIAEANGLSSAQSLTPGQVLVIPNKLTNIHNNASTFRPYSPGEAIGHIDPTLPAAPPPPQRGGDDGGCGGLGTILIIVVAIVATVYTAGAAAGLLAEAGALTGAAATSTWVAGIAAMSGGLGVGMTGVAIGAAAIGAAAGSVASQGVAMAMGMQQDFSWNQVGQAALGGAITAGVGSGLNNLVTAGSLSPTMSSWVTDSNSWQGAALKAGVGSVISQAAHGGSFSWRQVAAASVSGAVATQLGGGQGRGFDAGNDFAGFATKLAASTVSGWTSMAINANNTEMSRSSLGGLFEASLGQAIGDTITGSAAQAERERQQNSAQQNFRGSEIQAQNAAVNGKTTLYDGTTISDAENLRRIDLAHSKGVQLAAGDGFFLGGGTEFQVFPDVDVVGKRLAPIAAGRTGTQRDYAADLYASGAGDVRDTSPAAGLMIDPSTGLESFAYTSQMMQTPDPMTSTLTGLMYGAAHVVAEPILQIGDGLQVLNELGRSWVTGEAPRDINYLSGVGQMAGQGASTTQIVNSGFMSLMTAPDRIASAYQHGEYQQMGEEIGALGVGVAAAAAGARGSMPSLRMGVQLAAEDFGASSVGQRFAGQIESYQYGIGSLSYAGEPGLKLPQSWVMGPNDGPQFFQVANHGDMPTPRPGFNSHHGVMSAWMEANFPAYDADLAPAVLMSEANHRATFGVYNRWRVEMKAEQGGTFDWSNVPQSNARILSDRMFDASKTPDTIRQEYWQRFNAMKGKLE